MDVFRSPQPSLYERQLEVLRELCDQRVVISVKDCEAAGIDRRVLLRAVRDGLFERVSRGRYRSKHIDPALTWPSRMLQIAYDVREAALFGPSAARYWNLLIDHCPDKLWVAAPRGQWQPKFNDVRWVSWAQWRYAEHVVPFPGLPLLISTPERAVVEVVAYHEELGIEFAQEAMFRYVHDPRQAFMTLQCIASDYRCKALVTQLFADAWERIDEMPMGHIW